MLRVLPVVIAAVLTIYCLVEVFQADAAAVRTLPRPLWALLVFIPYVGAAGWLRLGRPTGARADRPARPAPVAPDDDPDFLRQLRRRRPGEDEFTAWEEDLHRKEGESDDHKPE